MTTWPTIHNIKTVHSFVGHYKAFEVTLNAQLVMVFTDVFAL